MEQIANPEQTIECPHCGQHISVDRSYSGITVTCPTCNGLISVPSFGPPPIPQSIFDSDVSDVADSEGASVDLGRAVKDTYQEFRKLDYSFLFPLRKFFNLAFLRKKAVTWVLTFGLLPLAILNIIMIFGIGFDKSSWLIGGYFCYFWAVYFKGLIKPSQPLWRRAIGYLIFTTVIGIPLDLSVQKWPIFNFLYAGANSENFIPRLLGSVLGVGVLEETCKALPLLLFSLRGAQRITIRDGVFLGLMSGLGFALAEVVSYSINYWQQTAILSANMFAQAAGESQGWFGILDQDTFFSKLREIVPNLTYYMGNILVAQIVRFIPLPLLHAAWAGTAGWFISVASARSKSRWPTISVGILFMAIIHGFYDTFSNGLIGLAIAAFSVIVFLCYLMHGEETDAPTL